MWLEATSASEKPINSSNLISFNASLLPDIFFPASALPLILSPQFSTKPRAHKYRWLHHIFVLGSISLSNQKQTPLPHTFLVNDFSFRAHSPDHQLIQGLMDGLSKMHVCV